MVCVGGWDLTNAAPCFTDLPQWAVDAASAKLAAASGIGTCDDAELVYEHVGACGCPRRCECQRWPLEDELNLALPAAFTAVNVSDDDGEVAGWTQSGNWLHLPGLAVSPLTVTGTSGVLPDGYALYILGLLATQIASACGEGDCLPPGATAVTREGISFQVGENPEIQTWLDANTATITPSLLVDPLRLPVWRLVSNG